MQLCTAEGFARIEIEAPASLQPGTAAFNEFLRRQGLYFGLADVKDCFHRMRQPPWLSKYFCWDAVPARWMEGLVGTVLEGRVVKPNDYVHPMPASLCMGFSWSLFFAQSASEHLMNQVSPPFHSCFRQRSPCGIWARICRKGETLCVCMLTTWALYPRTRQSWRVACAN